MKQFGKTLMIVLCLLAFCLTTAYAEDEAAGQEQGLDEIQPLMEMAEVDETEGMSLEEMTDVFSETAMSEYYESSTGFRMQYPAVFQFSEGAEGSQAVTADGKATLTIMHQPGGLAEDMLLEAIKLELPDAQPQKNEQNGCIRVDRTEENGAVCRTDLYLLTENSFHLITIRYAASEQETYSRYIEYMVNTIETSDTDLG